MAANVWLSGSTVFDVAFLADGKAELSSEFVQIEAVLEDG